MDRYNDPRLRRRGGADRQQSRLDDLMQDLEEHNQWQQDFRRDTVRARGIHAPGLFDERDLLDRPSDRRDDPMQDIGRSRAMEDPLVAMARAGYERQEQEQGDEELLANITGGYDPMGIMDEDFELYGPPSVRESIERAPDPMDPFYGEPSQFPRPRRDRARTSGYRLPPGARPDPPMPQDNRPLEGRMNLPQADMLLGARADPRLGGTPRPEFRSERRSPPPMPRRR